MECGQLSTFAEKEGGEDSQVGAHDDEQVRPLRDLGLEQLCVFDGLLRGVDGARANDHDDTVISASEDTCGIVTCFCDCALGGCARNLMAEKGGLDERLVL